MGRSGNRDGYKIFSINTTVRNPQRNLEFLIHFKKFDGFVFDNKMKINYLIELVKNGVYKFSIIPNHIKEKLENDILLNDKEIDELLYKNPQATGFAGRVMTQLRSLKDQGLLLFTGNSKKPTIKMTRLAYLLANKEAYVTDIYSKIMIGLHANNPTRTKIHNKSRVFLNTIFVIDLLKKEWNKQNKIAKGILKHEFVFILGMKDCNYKKCVQDILLYRSKNGLKNNFGDIKEYLSNNLGLLEVTKNTIKDYTDEVFRKFEMTGLLVSKGNFENIYYDFSEFNVKKIEAILEYYKDYKFETFNNAEEYINFLENVTLPWIDNIEVRKEVIKNKAEKLQLNVKKLDFSDLEILEDSLDRQFYSKSLRKVIDDIELDNIYDELEILIQNSDTKSSMENIPEPLRLEYLLALVFGKKFGSEQLFSNLIYNENGVPISYAPAGKVDLEYKDFLIEATMIKNRSQQLNSETTSIARHMYEKKKQKENELRTMLIAPFIHWDVALFFKFCTKEFESKLAPLTIKKFLEIIKSSNDLNEFKINFDSCVNQLTQLNSENYTDFVNN